MGTEKTSLVRFLLYLWVEIKGEYFNTNKLLSLAGLIVKYGLLNRPIIVLILTERYNRIFLHVGSRSD